MTKSTNTILKHKKPIYIIAYPKSGSTWIKRLVGEILNSPTGHISKTEGPLIEIDDGSCTLDGKYLILHSHYSDKDKPKLINIESKIIYIVRDFRDVLVSAFFHHYRIDKNLVLKSPENLKMNTKLKRIFWRGIVFNLEIQKMSRYWASISGGTSWFGFLKGVISMRWLSDLTGSGVGRWDSHVLFWKCFSPNVAFIKYEDMLRNPAIVVANALDKIEIPFDEDKINVAVENQSFSKKKKQFIEQNLVEKATFMRKGERGDYVNYLSDRTLKIIYKRYQNVMKDLNYELDVI